MLSPDFVKVKRLILEHRTFDKSQSLGDVILETPHMPKELTIQLSKVIKVRELIKLQK